MWTGLRPTSTPSGIIIHPTVDTIHQCYNTDTQTHTQTHRQWSDSIQQTVWEPVNSSYRKIVWQIDLRVWWRCDKLTVLFTARCSYASAVLGVVILSVCPSVRHMRALWLIQRTYWWYFYTIWKGNPSSFLPLNSGWWAMFPFTFNGQSKWHIPFKNRWRRQISACNVLTVRASENKFNYDE